VPQQQQQAMYFQQQPGQQQSQQQPTVGLARVPRPARAPQPAAPQEVYIEMSQVVGKQVITRSTGRNLGVISTLWVDPVRAEVVSLDLDDKKGVGSTRLCNFPLSRLTQIGDVVLVDDEDVLFDQPLDGRYGYYILPGMEVRTRNGDFLGKVRLAEGKWGGDTPR
jgi:sporulation protein YlmC with PRC-barrel domain